MFFVNLSAETYLKSIVSAPELIIAYEFHTLVDERRKVGVVIHKRYNLTIVGYEGFKLRAGACRAAELEGLGCVHELDGQHGLAVVGHLYELGGGVGTHAHVVFLTL